MYIIVLDLMLYSEPLEKVRNERLERIMLTSDLEVLFDFLQLANARLKLEHHFRDATKVTEVGSEFPCDL
jgi:retron-type reverse transcriptase